MPLPNSAAYKCHATTEYVAYSCDPSNGAGALLHVTHKPRIPEGATLPHVTSQGFISSRSASMENVCIVTARDAGKEQCTMQLELHTAEWSIVCDIQDWMSSGERYSSPRLPPVDGNPHANHVPDTCGRLHTQRHDSL